MMKSARPARALSLVFGSGALALPALAAVTTAATAATTTAATPAATHRTAAARSVKYDGITVPARQWGTVTVNITLQRTGSGAAASRKFTDLGGGYTYHTARSQYIMSQALPILRQEFLAAQSARIHLVSGATYTSQAFIHSLQSALSKAHA